MTVTAAPKGPVGTVSTTSVTTATGVVYKYFDAAGVLLGQAGTYQEPARKVSA